MVDSQIFNRLCCGESPVVSLIVIVGLINCVLIGPFSLIIDALDSGGGSCGVVECGGGGGGGGGGDVGDVDVGAIG